MKKISFGIFAGILLFGGAIWGVFAQLNPYVELPNRFQITIPTSQSGITRVTFMKTRPEIIFEKWDGEVRMALTYPRIQSAGTRNLLSNRIEWIQGSEMARGYPLSPRAGEEEGAYEFEIIMPVRPLNNRIEFW